MGNRHEDLDEMGKNVHFIEVFFKRQHVFVPRDRKTEQQEDVQKVYKRCTKSVQKILVSHKGVTNLAAIKHKQASMNKEENTSQREFQIYELLRQAALDGSILVREDDWKRIENEAKILWPDLGRKIYERGIHLSDIEMRICWMAKMRIPPQGMANILKRSNPAISLARARLYEKLKGEKGSGKMFDVFIRNL